MTNTKAKRETNTLTKDFGKGSESWSFSPPDIPSYGSQGHFIRGDFLWAAPSKSRNDAKGEEIVRSPAVIKDPQLLVGWFSDVSLDLTKILDCSQPLFYFVPQEKGLTVKLARLPRFLE